ncbi:MAG: P83/100 family protein [Spirochaetaceae bacterium]
MLPRRLFLLFSLFLIPFRPVFAQDVDVDREELESQAEAVIEFENYEGTEEEVSSAGEIRGIGETLARDIAPEGGSTAEYFDRYTLFRGLDPTDPEGLDADVLSINENATVNHIDNVRRIISGYLTDAFAYDSSDADLIAELTTIYNAVYRGNLQFFSGRYKRIVSDYLTPEAAGISTNYADWPGETQLVIPLSSGREAGDLDAVSPLQLSDPAVIEDLRQRRDMGIETRKAMIAFIERVIEERREAVEEEREQIEEEREQIEERREEIEEEREEIAREEPEEPDEPEEPVEPEEPAEEPAEEREAEEEAEPAEAAEEAEEEDSEQRTAELDEEEAELDEREAELDEREEELEEEEEEVEELTERAQELYEETSEDQEELIEEEGRQEEAAAAEPVLLFLVEGDGEAGRLALVDRRNGEILSEYEGAPLRRGAFPRYRGGIVAIEQSNGEESRALLLDEESLESVHASEGVVYRGTTVTVDGEALYMVLREEGAWKIGRFSEELEIQRSSVVAVHPNTDIVLSGGTLLAQNPRGRVLLLDARELRVTR